jgi:hypothetical protein
MLQETVLFNWMDARRITSSRSAHSGGEYSLWSITTSDNSLPRLSHWLASRVWPRDGHFFLPARSGELVPFLVTGYCSRSIGSETKALFFPPPHPFPSPRSLGFPIAYARTTGHRQRRSRAQGTQIYFLLLLPLCTNRRLSTPSVRDIGNDVHECTGCICCSLLPLSGRTPAPFSGAL